MEGLSEALASDFEASDTPTGNPTETETNEQVKDEAVDTAPATDSADPEDLKAWKEQYLQKYPDQAEAVERIHREMQSGLTPKLQEAAAARKALEGLDEQTIAFARQAQQLYQHNPAAAADYLAQQAEALRQAHQAADPYANLEYATDTERVLAERLRQQDSVLNDLVAQKNRGEVERQLAELGQQWGEVPLEQRQGVIQYLAQHRLPPTEATGVWKSLYGMDAALKKGRQEGATGQRLRTGATPPPSTVTPRAGTKPAIDPNLSFRDGMRQALKNDYGE